MKTKKLFIAIAITTSIISTHSFANGGKVRPPVPESRSTTSINDIDTSWYDSIFEFFGL